MVQEAPAPTFEPLPHVQSCSTLVHEYPSLAEGLPSNVMITSLPAKERRPLYCLFSRRPLCLRSHGPLLCLVMLLFSLVTIYAATVGIHYIPPDISHRAFLAIFFIVVLPCVACPGLCFLFMNMCLLKWGGEHHLNPSSKCRKILCNGAYCTGCTIMVTLGFVASFVWIDSFGYKYGGNINFDGTSHYFADTALGVSVRDVANMPGHGVYSC